MNKNNEFLYKINEGIKKCEDKFKSLYDKLNYHKKQIKDSAKSISIYGVYHNVPSIYEHFIEIEKIEAKMEILDEILWFLKDLKEDIENDK